MDISLTMGSVSPNQSLHLHSSVLGKSWHLPTDSHDSAKYGFMRLLISPNSYQIRWLAVATPGVSFCESIGDYGFTMSANVHLIIPLAGENQRSRSLVFTRFPKSWIRCDCNDACQNSASRLWAEFVKATRWGSRPRVQQRQPGMVRTLSGASAIAYGDLLSYSAAPERACSLLAILRILAGF